MEKQLPGQRELAMLAGFTDPTQALRHGERKQSALVLRCRIVAEKLAREEGPKVRMKDVAARCGATERALYNHFSARDALFAFPPPEMATAMVKACHECETWQGMLARLHLLFSALEGNDDGRDLMGGLAALHRSCPTLGSTDGHFLSQLRRLLEPRNELAGQAWPIAAMFTEALRQSFSIWAIDPTNSTLEVLDRTVAIVGSAELSHLITSALVAQSGSKRPQ